MELIGFFSIGVLIVLQIATFAYSYGKINQKVASIDKRLNDISHYTNKMENRIGKLEGRE